MRKVLVAACSALVVVGAAVAFWPRDRKPELAEPPPVAAAPGWFENVAASAGITFRYVDPATPQHLISETLPGGVGWIDYDADGWPDLFCLQTGTNPAHTHALYRNNRDGTFADVTDRAGLRTGGFGFGCAVGDYDNDGFDDLFVSYVDRVALYHNEPGAGAPGGRRFVDVTAKSGLLNPHWGTSCAWGDLDGDGLLDLYVCNYVVLDPAEPSVCTNRDKNLNYACSPTAYPQVVHRLFRNTGNGVFADVTTLSGVGKATPAPGLGVVVLDLDGDGRPDIYAANDMGPAYLFKNLGGMRFEEVALPAGAAFGPGGQRIAGMGIAVGDFDASGRPSLFVTNFHRAPNVLFTNRGGLRFDDHSYLSGLGGPSIERLGFGASAPDVDLDGNLDLAVANGHVHRCAREILGVPYAQEAQLFLGDGAGKFRDASAEAGPDFLTPRVGRGLARVDFDGDGRPDLVMSGIGQPIALFRNRHPTSNGWVVLDLIGDGRVSNRNAVGATVRVEWAGKARTHFVIGGGSYLSADERRLLIGLGAAAKLDRVTVRWPSGKTEEFRDLPARTRWRLREGAGTAEPLVLPGK